MNDDTFVPLFVDPADILLEAGDLYELCGARAPAPCPAKLDPSDNKCRFILSDCINSTVRVGWIAAQLIFKKYYKMFEISI